MKMHFGVALAMAFVTLCAAGCATKMDAADAGRIKSIVITTVAEPNYYYQGRGANEDFNPAMRSQGLHLGSEMADAIAKALRGAGYDVSVGGEAARADAVMEITLGGLLPDQLGPIYARQTGGLEPVLTIKVRLRDSSTGKTLFGQLFEIADPPIRPMDGTVLIIPDRRYAIVNGNDAGLSPSGAAEGFRSVIPPVAESIAASLKKSN